MSAGGVVVRAGVLTAVVAGGAWFGYRFAQELRDWWLAIGEIGAYPLEADELFDPSAFTKAMQERRHRGRELRVHQVAGDIIPGVPLPTADEVAAAAIRTMGVAP